jgi:hypothetical protein
VLDALDELQGTWPAPDPVPVAAPRLRAAALAPS